MGAKIKYLLRIFKQPDLLVLFLAVIFSGLLFYRLNDLFPKLSVSELDTISRSQTLHSIIINPTNILFRFPELLLFKSLHRTPGDLRLISVFVSISFLILFYFIVRSRNTPRMAFLSTAILGTSTWFLITARTASPDVFYLSTLLIIGTVTIFKKIPHKKSSAFLIILLSSLLIYVPGMIWFLFFVVICFRNQIQKLIKNIPDWIIVSGLLWSMLILFPLIYALLHQTVTFSDILGLPASLPNPLLFIKNILNVPIQLFIRGPDLQNIWLGRLPLLDVFSSGMFILGLYVSWINWGLEYSRMLIYSLIFSTFLISIGGVFTLTVIIPFVYLIISLGLAYFLQQWLSVFPVNPIARGLGVSMLAISVVIIGVYHSSRYFIAFPDSSQHLKK